MIACHLGNSTMVTSFTTQLAYTGYKGIVYGRCHPVETDKARLCHLPLSLRIEPDVFSESIHDKVSAIIAIILRPCYTVGFGVHLLKAACILPGGKIAKADTDNNNMTAKKLIFFIRFWFRKLFI